MGGGILPVAHHNNQWYFLFGRENDGKKWGDFGGSKEGTETFYQTAIREGYEELNGFYGSMSELRRKVTRNKVTQIEQIDDTGKYKTYIFKVDYDANLPTYYTNNFRFINNYSPEIVNNKPNGMYEKDMIKWFSLDELTKQRRNFRGFYIPIVDKIVEIFNDVNNIKYKI
tara:strand:- start:1461 stop:1970 length:510 start_codon:yes stop_codon:yes gene_type:complete